MVLLSEKDNRLWWVLKTRWMHFRVSQMGTNRRGKAAYPNLSYLTIIYSPKWRWILVDIYMCIYHTRWTPSRPKSNLICDNIPTKATLFSFSCLEVNSTWLITSELGNQHAWKVLFICVVYTKCNIQDA